jgi:NAD(P)-dependent dehydrogenase (short-subunit alcohol dehydrogenase family)
MTVATRRSGRILAFEIGHGDQTEQFAAEAHEHGARLGREPRNRTRGRLHARVRGPLADLESLAKEAPGGYGASKAALDAMARLFAKEFQSRGILVNAVSPGWARTDMGGAGAPRSVRQGADSVLWGVRLPPGGPTGGVFEDGKAID